MRSNAVSVLCATKRVSNSQTSVQADVLAQRLSPLNVWSADIPIVLLWRMVIVAEPVDVADLPRLDSELYSCYNSLKNTKKATYEL